MSIYQAKEIEAKIEELILILNCYAFKPTGAGRKHFTRHVSFACFRLSLSGRGENLLLNQVKRFIYFVSSWHFIFP